MRTALLIIVSSRFLAVTVAIWLLALFFTHEPRAAESQVAEPAVQIPAGHPDTLFLTSHDCLACHNGLTTPTGEDVSIGVSWRASMMANSSRDPVLAGGGEARSDGSSLGAAEIEDECSICHMPMSRTQASGGRPAGRDLRAPADWHRTPDDDRLAADGVSCTVCHQIGPERLGTRESFTGGFVSELADRCRRTPDVRTVRHRRGPDER